MEYDKLVTIIRDNISAWIGKDEDMAQYDGLVYSIAEDIMGELTDE